MNVWRFLFGGGDKPPKSIQAKEGFRRRDPGGNPSVVFLLLKPRKKDQAAFTRRTQGKPANLRKRPKDKGGLFN